MNEEREVTKARQFLTKKPDVLARRPGVDDIRRTGIGKYSRPIALHLIKAMDGIILFSEAGPPVGVFGDCNGGGMATRNELVGEIMDVDGAVRAEIVVKNEQDVTHAERRL
jgi:hypothetical protein